MAILALSLSVRLLLRIAPVGPRRSFGWVASQARSCAASCVESREALAASFAASVGFGRPGIRGAVARSMVCRGGFELRRLPFEVGPGPTPVLRRIARELHPIDGKHLAADQSLGIADRDDRREHPRDIVAQRADEMRDGREMGVRYHRRGR